MLQRKFPKLVVSDSLLKTARSLYFCICIGISERTVSRIRAEYREKGVFSTPKKRYARPRICKDADNFDRDAIRQKIHSLYKNKENLNLKKILVCNIIKF